MKCPYCGNEATAEFIDNGVGFQQIEPYDCDNCQASEIPFHMLTKEQKDALLPEELKKGWYVPSVVTPNRDNNNE